MGILSPEGISPSFVHVLYQIEQAGLRVRGFREPKARPVGGRTPWSDGFLNWWGSPGFRGATISFDASVDPSSPWSGPSESFLEQLSDLGFSISGQRTVKSKPRSGVGRIFGAAILRHDSLQGVDLGEIRVVEVLGRKSPRVKVQLDQADAVTGISPVDRSPWVTVEKWIEHNVRSTPPRRPRR